MEDDANIINERRETYIEDPEATSAAKEYTRIQEDMLLNVKYKVGMSPSLKALSH